jgi:hypothetical protein
MTERNRAAVDVGPAMVVAGLLEPGHDHGSEGLVDLDQVDVGHGHARLLERIFRGWNRRGQVPDGVIGAHAHMVNAGAWLEVVALERWFTHQHAAAASQVELETAAVMEG